MFAFSFDLLSFCALFWKQKCGYNCSAKTSVQNDQLEKSFSLLTDRADQFKFDLYDNSFYQINHFLGSESLECFPVYVAIKKTNNKIKVFKTAD